MDRMSQMNYLIKNVTIISPDSHGSNQRNIVIDQGIIKVIATDAIPIDFNGVVINGGSSDRGSQFCQCPPPSGNNI